MRVSVRLTDAQARMVEAIQRATGQSASEVVGAAVHAYYEAVFAPRKTARESIQASGLVGCGAAGPDLSTHGKAGLFGALAGGTKPE